jgi:hypothetical protein
MAKKLSAVTLATSHFGSKAKMWPTRTATAIFSMNAIAMPHRMGKVLYRVASSPVV